MPQHDILIIGSGIAGATLALRLAQRYDVAVVTKDWLGESNSAHAQGGIASVVDARDKFEQHEVDTLVAGDGICDYDAVHAVVGGGREAIAALEKWGVNFARTGAGEYDLGQEGGHTSRRVLHSGDITGAEIQVVLVQRLREVGVHLYENHLALDLLQTDRLKIGKPGQILGAYVLAPDNSIQLFRSAYTILAAGGAGKVYLFTSNPDGATGDGLAMAARCGISLVNMEFFQFHPTCLYHPQAKNFLISEAVRGEGAVLVNRKGTRIMEGVHPLADLAPRDVVARSIDHYLKESGDDSVFLDCTGIGRHELEARFPNLYRACAGFGLDMAVDPLPVVPAAHYQCGGIDAGIDGATTLTGLAAIGESSYTGLHGANRLASNSLLEGVVQAARLSDRLLTEGVPDQPTRRIPDWKYGASIDAREKVLVSHAWDEIRRLMWNYLGIVRSEQRLLRALQRIHLINRETHSYYWNVRPDRDIIELRNLGLVAELIIQSARFRRESRGLHTMLDYPDHKEAYIGATVVKPQSGDAVLRPVAPAPAHLAPRVAERLSHLEAER